MNKKLEAKAKFLKDASLVDASAEHGIRKEETAHYLVDYWATMNLGRTALTGLAAVLAMWASIERLKVGRFRVIRGAERVERGFMGR